MYKVISRFLDRQDNNHPYNEGDTYPREGYEPSLERICQLSSRSNRLRKPLIEKTEEEKTEPVDESQPETEVVDKPKKKSKKRG